MTEPAAVLEDLNLALTDVAADFVEASSATSTAFRDLNSALIDADYRQHIDGHLTFRIGDVAAKY